MYHRGEGPGDIFFQFVNFGFTNAIGILIIEP